MVTTSSLRGAILSTLLSLVSLAAAAPSPSALDSDLTIIVNNDLQGPASPSTNASILLLSNSLPFSQASQACSSLGESLYSPEILSTSNIKSNIDYLLYRSGGGKSSSLGTTFWIAPSSKNPSVTRVLDVSPSSGRISISDVRNGKGKKAEYPVLCTQTAPFSNNQGQDKSAKWQVGVEGVNGGNEKIIGFRDRLSFRFLGLRYAPKPERFTYSTLYRGDNRGKKQKEVSGLEYGSQCVQNGGGEGQSEDCLFLNVWTPYLPAAAGGDKGKGKKKKDLRPVAVWIHGGAFTGGTSSDATFDGGNMASRGDVVVVAINYRLSSLGFLALADGKTNGNYGLSDQVTALQWVRENIAKFGGDPEQVTIFGQSAGAGSVRALLASPKAKGLFARAIPLSNLGGINYGTTYSRYYTIAEETAVVGNAVLAANNCTDVACLRKVPAEKLTTGAAARYLVVDGTYLVSPELDLSRSAGPSGIDLMMGITHDDGAPFISYPSTTNQAAYLLSQGFSPSLASPALFPLPPTPNATLALFNASSRLATDGIFRCIDQATVQAGLTNNRFSRVFYYEFDRTYQTGGWPNLDVCEPPKSASHPFGDPSKPYLRCHSGELYYVFGNLARQGLPMRDEKDLPFEQFVLDSFSSFIRTGDPNPDEEFLRKRGFETTRREVRRSEWRASTRRGGVKLKVLDWPSRLENGWREERQCEGIGLPVDYYL
ncbi:Alpha/Beta hydrolase protein [Sordaria brevicollis]|uniref:Alpha/Beta hydrolase protein n=1 Tax=Sordaria brevicollis TaxID=83679 RepID=A0AAE0U5P2_SORBR|nr:Alpha/Beta hydrolase protein [Sordaria brevicollis]